MELPLRREPGVRVSGGDLSAAEAPSGVPPLSISFWERIRQRCKACFQNIIVQCGHAPDRRDQSHLTSQKL